MKFLRLLILLAEPHDLTHDRVADGARRADLSPAAAHGTRFAEDLLEFNRDRFRLDFNVVAPEGDAHDQLNDLHVGVEAFQVFGLMRGAEHVRVGRVGLLGAHAVVEALRLKESSMKYLLILPFFH